MKLSQKLNWLVLLAVFGVCGPECGSVAVAGSVVVDHTCTDIRKIPPAWVTQAKHTLHIAYGHTSHGSQVVDGMTGLVGFMNGKNYTTNLYAWNAGGTNGALDLTDMPFGWIDLGDPDGTTWEKLTRSYLSTNPLCNVIMWAWCGTLTTASAGDITNYLTLMEGLERDFTNVTFVHMTGHLDGWGPEGNLNQRNNQIRNYCLVHGAVLYDFADIESYDPDATTNYMLLYANDACWYGPTGSQNWALNWQSNHVEGTDWYNCTSVHTQPLNGNLKAYAAWWLWGRLAGWEGPAPAAPKLQFNRDRSGPATVIYYQIQSVPADEFALEMSSNLVTWNLVSAGMFNRQTLAVSNNWQRIVMQSGGALPAKEAWFRLYWAGQ